MSLSRAKSWLKEKTKSKPFQWIISVGQGVSLGSSLHDALTKLLSISTLGGLAARVLGNINYGTAALVGIILTYMTRNAIGTNIKNMDEQSEKVQEHDIKLEAGEKKFLNQQMADIRLLDILIKMNSDKKDVVQELQQLLSDKMDNYDKPDRPLRREITPDNPLNRPGFYQISSSSVNSLYEPLIEITRPRVPSSPSRTPSFTYRNSDHFFSSSTSNLHIGTPNTEVAIEIPDERKEDETQFTPRSLGARSQNG